MNLSVKGILTGAGLALVGLSGSARAQATPATASIQATATVATALTATPVQNLDFGATFGGIARTVLPADATSGEFTLTGGADAEVSVTFPTPPASLTGPVGSTPIPIAFGAASGGHNIAGTRAGATSFDPSVALVTRLDATTGNLSVYLGGTVSPAANQMAGSYANTINLSAAYTGN